MKGFRFPFTVYIITWIVLFVFALSSLSICTIVHFVRRTGRDAPRV
nr:MAG TPA: hypothetical protein [Caudoviricetes sp.]